MLQQFIKLRLISLRDELKHSNLVLRCLILRVIEDSLLKVSLNTNAVQIIYKKRFLIKSYNTSNQCCEFASGSKLDPYSGNLWIRILNTDPHRYMYIGQIRGKRCKIEDINSPFRAVFQIHIQCIRIWSKIWIHIWIQKTPESGSKLFLKTSVVDLDPHGSGTFGWIRNYYSGSRSSKTWKSRLMKMLFFFEFWTLSTVVWNRKWHILDRFFIMFEFKVVVFTISK